MSSGNVDMFCQSFESYRCWLPHSKRFLRIFSRLIPGTTPEEASRVIEKDILNQERSGSASQNLLPNHVKCFLWVILSMFGVKHRNYRFLFHGFRLE